MMIVSTLSSAFGVVLALVGWFVRASENACYADDLRSLALVACAIVEPCSATGHAGVGESSSRQECFSIRRRTNPRRIHSLARFTAGLWLVSAAGCNLVPDADQDGVADGFGAGCDSDDANPLVH